MEKWCIVMVLWWLPSGTRTVCHANRHETSRNVYKWVIFHGRVKLPERTYNFYLSNKNISNDLTADIVVCWFNNIEAWCSGAVRSVVPKCEIHHTDWKWCEMMVFDSQFIRFHQLNWRQQKSNSFQQVDIWDLGGLLEPIPPFWMGSKSVEIPLLNMIIHD